MAFPSLGVKGGVECSSTVGPFHKKNEPCKHSPAGVPYHKRVQHPPCMQLRLRCHSDNTPAPQRLSPSIQGATIRAVHFHSVRWSGSMDAGVQQTPSRVQQDLRWPSSKQRVGRRGEGIPTEDKHRVNEEPAVVKAQLVCIHPNWLLPNCRNT